MSRLLSRLAAVGRIDQPYMASQRLKQAACPADIFAVVSIHAPLLMESCAASVQAGAIPHRIKPYRRRLPRYF
jgi:hypothetical protein